MLLAYLPPTVASSVPIEVDRLAAAHVLAAIGKTAAMALAWGETKMCGKLVKLLVYVWKYGFTRVHEYLVPVPDYLYMYLLSTVLGTCRIPSTSTVKLSSQY